MNLADTIVAISTPPGRGGLGVVRLSGSQARVIAAEILQFPNEGGLRSWGATLATLADADGRSIDQVVATLFERPRSYTAEDVVEISCHGSPVILRHVMERACLAGARPAEPGEFTLRAFLNGRINLPQAEAVRNLIEATTLYQAKVAARQMEGSVARRLAPLKERLVDLISLLEAGIDFADDDLPVADAAQILERLDPVLDDLRRFTGTFAYGRLVHSGVSLAIVGRPNVGKSSLFNRLLDRDRAIVTEIPGTTRDLVSEMDSLGGVPVRYVDTAGIRESADRIEALGVERSYAAMADADLTLVVIDLSAPLTPEDLALIAKARGQGAFVVAGNKCDLPRLAETGEEVAVVSALTGEGIPELKQRVLSRISPSEGWGAESDFITSVRHEQLLRECLASLEKARAATIENVFHEFLLLDLYGALQALDAVTGATTADDILNRIFSTFCIGK